MHRPEVEPAIFRSQVQRPKHYTTEPPNLLHWTDNKLKIIRIVLESAIRKAIERCWRLFVFVQDERDEQLQAQFWLRLVIFTVSRHACLYYFILVFFAKTWKIHSVTSLIIKGFEIFDHRSSILYHRKVATCRFYMWEIVGISEIRVKLLGS